MVSIRNRTLGMLAAIVLVMCCTSSFAAEVRLQGAGATFPQPLYERWVAEYQKVDDETKIDYQGIGSGGGIKGITDQTIDFAGSDAPMSPSEIQAAGGADNLIEIPTCAGGVVPAYNLPALKQDLNFTGEILADIFLGTITKWNDAKIAAVNPGVQLPNVTITPAWRTDGSGTTFVWTNYLCTQSPEFKSSIGAGKQVKWPLGQGGKGNQGVAQVVQQTVGAIGYVEQGYADQNQIPYGAVRNRSGKFIKASPQSVSLAGAGGADQMQGQVLASNIWNQPGDGAYPIASFTYLIVYKNLKNIESAEQAESLAAFLWWATHDGQRFAQELDYAPLAAPVQAKVEAALGMLAYNGRKVGSRR